MANEGDSAKQSDGTEVMGRDSLPVVSKQDLATELNRADAHPGISRSCPRGMLALGRLCGRHERCAAKGENREVRSVG